jgi:DNA end-binding protein Ku
MEVPADQVIKGYEYAKGQYVELTDEDFESLPIPSKHTLEVASFVKSSEIDPIYYDTSYVLEAAEAGKKPYALFMHALNSKGMVAVAHITLRKKEQLCILRPEKGNLMLETLFYADEIRVDLDKEMPEIKITPQEEKMAEALVDLLAADFDAKEYKDTYREALMQVIDSKLEGKQVVSAPTPEATKVTDLMEALRASVEAAKKRRAS